MIVDLITNSRCFNVLCYLKSGSWTVSQKKTLGDGKTLCQQLFRCVFHRWALPGSRHAPPGPVQQQQQRGVGHQAEAQCQQGAVKDGQTCCGSARCRSDPAKREQTPRSPLFLSHSPSERRGTRRQMGEADPWRFCQEQSLKTVHDHINMHRPPSLLPFSSTHHSIIPLLRSHSAAVLRAKKKKKALTVTHYFQQRTWQIENRGEGVDSISSSERADGDAEHLWLQGPHSALKPASMFPVVGFVHPSPVQMWNIFFKELPTNILIFYTQTWHLIIFILRLLGFLNLGNSFSL